MTVSLPGGSMLRRVLFRTPVRTVLVRGRSMEPGLRDGDCLVVRPGGRVRAGDRVVAELRDRPGLLVVKRAREPVDGGWHVVSDNATAPGAASGTADVQAVVLFRYWPPSARRRRERRQRPGH